MERRRSSVPGELPEPPTQEEDVSYIFNYFSNIVLGNLQTEMEWQVTKVAISNVLLWFLAWTPYAIVVLMGAFGNRQAVTPMMSQIPAFLAKLASAINPVVTALSHPRFREAMFRQFPWLGVPEIVLEETKTAVNKMDLA